MSTETTSAGPTAAAAAAERPVMFVHTNAKQRLGALVSVRSFRRNARDPAAFDVRLIEAEGCAPPRQLVPQRLGLGGAAQRFGQRQHLVAVADAGA